MHNIECHLFLIKPVLKQYRQQDQQLDLSTLKVNELLLEYIIHWQAFYRTKKWGHVGKRGVQSAFFSVVNRMRPALLMWSLL